MKHKTAEQLIAFEARVRSEFAAGDLPFLVHLCGGNESQLIEIFEKARPRDWFFSTHRNHYHYLLAGGSEGDLMEKIRDGRSMFVFDKKLNFVSSAVLGGLCGVAAGLAWELKQKQVPLPVNECAFSTVAFRDHFYYHPHVWCFVGDGAEDNGHLYEAVLFVEGHKLPCTFVIEDNDRSVDTRVFDRTGGFRMEWPACVQRYCYTPTYPHAGPGLKEMIQFKPEVVRKFAR